jgi:hypothetical protein
MPRHSKSWRAPDGIELDKIGVTELMMLKMRSRVYYVVIPKDDVGVFKLLTGDMLKVRIEGVFRQNLHQEDTEKKKKSDEEWES